MVFEMPVQATASNQPAQTSMENMNTQPLATSNLVICHVKLQYTYLDLHSTRWCCWRLNTPRVSDFLECWTYTRLAPNAAVFWYGPYVFSLRVVFEVFFTKTWRHALSESN